MGFDLNSYEQVKDRITRFYKDHADGRILTELVTAPAEMCDHAGFKALVYLGETLKATGYAYEAKGQRGVNADAWVENCETSAIGRALANMDYCGSLRPSQEEMSKTEVVRNQGSTAQDQCAVLAKELGLPDDEKKQMWQDSGQNWSNLLIMLKDYQTRKLGALEVTLAKAMEAQK